MPSLAFEVSMASKLFLGKDARLKSLRLLLMRLAELEDEAVEDVDDEAKAFDWAFELLPTPLLKSCVGLLFDDRLAEETDMFFLRPRVVDLDVDSVPGEAWW